MKHCGNCIHYDDGKCTKEWNNLEPEYYIPDRDDREPDDSCEEWEENNDA